MSDVDVDTGEVTDDVPAEPASDDVPAVDDGDAVSSSDTHAATSNTAATANKGRRTVDLMRAIDRLYETGPMGGVTRGVGP